MRLILKIPACIFLLWPFVVPAQYHYSNYQLYTARDGFRFYETYGWIYKDREKFVWIPTDNGLYRFDGQNFKVYRRMRDIQSHYTWNYFQSIYQDRRKNHYVTTYEGRLFQLDAATGRFTLWQGKDEKGIPAENLRWKIFFEDSRGDLWVVIGFKGIAKVDLENKRYQLFSIFPAGDPGYKDIDIGNILELKNGKFLIPTLKGLVEFDPADKSCQAWQDRAGPANQSDNSFLSIHADKKNEIWVGTWGSGIKHFDYTSRKFTEYKWRSGKDKGTMNIATSLCQFDERHLAVGSEQGLLIFDTEAGTFRPLKNPAAGAGDFSSAFQCYRDSDGIVWAVTNAGLLKLNPRENLFNWVALPEGGRFTDPGAVVDIGHWPGDSLYYVAAQYGLEFFEYNERTGNLTCFPIKKSDAEENDVNDIEFESRDRIWLASTKGVYIFDRNSKKMIRSPLHNDPVFGNRKDIVDIAKAANGIWWIATGDGGLFKYNSATGHMEHYSTGSPGKLRLKTDRLFTIFIDSKNNCWFGNADNQSVGCIPASGDSIVYYNNQNGFPAGNCRSIEESKEGKIFYVLRGTGLCVLDHPLGSRPKVTIYNSSNGLPTDRVLSLFRDKKDRVWMSTSDGIVLCNTSNMQITRFTTYDGLKNNISFSNFFENENGQMFIGYPQGFHFFDPATLLQGKENTGNIILHSFTVGGQEKLPAIDTENKLSLSYADNPLYFEFAALTYTDNPFIQYAYKLEGVDKDWVYPGTRRYGAYAHLPGGDYRLLIKAANRAGIWNQHFALAIQVKPPFWQTWWFRLLALAAVASLTLWLVKRRIYNIRKAEERKTYMNKLKAEAEMKALRAQMNPHFIFNCMNTIDAYMHKNNTREASHFLNQFSKLVRSVLENSQHAFITISKDMEALQLYIELEKRRFENSFTYEIILSPEIEKAGYKIPPLLIQPYVENAIQHGLRHKENGGGRLSIRFDEGGQQLLCTIDDNGIGREASARINNYRSHSHQSLGLKVTSERIDMLNYMMNVASDIRIIDKLDNETGTTVILTLPKIV